MVKSVRPLRFFELQIWTDTGNYAVERPSFLSDRIRPLIPQVPIGRIFTLTRPRQVLGPYRRAYAPTGHLGDTSLRSFYTGLYHQRFGTHP